MHKLALALWVSAVVVACGDDGPADVPGARPGQDGSVTTFGGNGGGGAAGASGAAGATAGAAGATAAAAGAAGEGAGGTETAAGAGGAAGSPAVDAPPADAAAVNAFLQTRAYREWPQETAQHVSKGPHGGTVKVFLNPALDASFAAGNASHPAGSIAVKEFYQDGKPSGFAYSAKLAADSAGGDEWYWYEVFTDAPAQTAPFAGKGITLCKNCHAGGGRDFVLIEYPLK